MILTTLPGLPFKLDAPAADALEQAFANGCPRSHITETFRSYADQVSLFLARYTQRWITSGPYGDVRWWKGVRYVRTSGLGMAAIPGTSVHGSGLAIDCNDPMRSWLRSHPEYGFTFPIPSERWHAEFKASRYTHKATPPAEPTTATHDEGDDMRYFAITRNPGSDIYELGPSGSWIKLSESQWRAIGSPLPEIVTHDELRALSSLASQRRKSLA